MPNNNYSNETLNQKKEHILWQVKTTTEGIDRELTITKNTIRYSGLAKDFKRKFIEEMIDDKYG